MGGPTGVWDFALDPEGTYRAYRRGLPVWGRMPSADRTPKFPLEEIKLATQGWPTAAQEEMERRSRVETRTRGARTTRAAR